MHWHYRILRNGDTYSLHEYYVVDEELGDSWTLEPITFVGESKEEVIQALDMALKDARNRSVVDIT